VNDTPAVVLPVLGPPLDQLWDLLLVLGDELAVAWTVIGGQMVLLHAIEHGQVPAQISQDLDVVANVRAAPGALSAVVKVLQAHGLTLAGASPEGIAHRYERPAEPRPIVVDVLAPDGLGARADLTTTPPGRTLEVPGGTQALARTTMIAVSHAGRIGAIPRPNLLGAIILKAAACGLTGDPARHLRDLALLCALVGDPFALTEELTVKDRRRLRLARPLADHASPAWALLPAELRGPAQYTYRILAS
jgi:hypothetical protein